MEPIEEKASPQVRGRLLIQVRIKGSLVILRVFMPRGEVAELIIPLEPQEAVEIAYALVKGACLVDPSLLGDRLNGTDFT